MKKQPESDIYEFVFFDRLFAKQIDYWISTHKCSL